MITAKPTNHRTVYASIDSIDNHWELTVNLLLYNVERRRAQWREYRGRNRERLNKKARDNMRRLRAERKANG